MSYLYGVSFWMAKRGLRMPSTAWLHEARMQLLGARADAQICVTYGDLALRRYRNKIMITPMMGEVEYIEPVVFRWTGEAHIPFPTWGGVLHFDQAESGIDETWLRQHSLRLQQHAGGGRLKLAENRPNRSLKVHFQALGVPAWERERLPLVYAGKELLFAAGIGQDCRHPLVAGGICLRWLNDSGGI